MSQARRPRELGARPASSRRTGALATLLAAVVVALAVWLRPRDGGASVGPAAAPPQPAAFDEARGSAPPANVELRDPVDPDARRDAPDGVDGEFPVELWVRLVETAVLQPRPGELRPARRGVGGAHVTWVGAHSAVSDADGLVRFADLAPRAGELRVAPQGGLLGWSGTLDLAAPSGGLRRSGARLTFELELRADLGSFEGRVLDAAGAAVAGAALALVRGGTAERRAPGDADLLAPVVHSDADGRFTLPRVQGEERLELLVACERPGLPAGHVRQIGPQELAEREPLEVRLPPARDVHMRVLESDGTPAAGVLCLQRDGALWPQRCEPRLAHAARPAHATVERAGELALELDDGAWVVHFLPSRAGASRRLFQFTLVQGGATEFEFRLP